MLDNIKEYVNHGKPNRKFEIKNSVNAKINAVNNIIKIKSFKNLYIIKLKPKKIDKKTGNNIANIANGWVALKTINGLCIQDKKIKKKPRP